MSKTIVGKYLTGSFLKKHVNALLNHFVRMVAEFEEGEWEDSIVRAGKFTEAVLKALAVHACLNLATGKKFKVDKVINDLAQLPPAAHDDTIRLTIPRACRFIYDVASNRGRHDADEIDPNEMDANGLVMTSSWILAELVRYSQKGAVDTESIRQLVGSLVAKKYPSVEEVEGRTYFHGKGLSALNVALLALAHVHPGRLSEDEVRNIVVRHGFTIQNSRTALQRVKEYTDEDNAGRLRLLVPGLRRAEEIRRNKLHG